ncbi:MAG: hypothetical protein Q9175_004402, partial [Cornicularia normoerica]
NTDAPLRSALRQIPSALRRSVSSVSFDLLPRAKLNEYIPPTLNTKSLKDINNELAAKSSSATNLQENPPRTTSNPPSETPMKVLIPKKAWDSKITKTPVQNGKVQTKLNVTRELKKLKGRAVESPITSMQAPKKEIVLSSGEDSTTSEELVWQTGNAKAGPSSRKPTFPITPFQGKKTAEVKPPAAPIDPIIRNIKVEKDKTAASANLPRTNLKSDTKSLQKSISRSPALALSETSSMSSGSASSTASDSELESDSEEGLQAPPSTTPTGAKVGKLAPVTMKGVNKAVNVGAKQPEGHLQSRASSPSSQVSTSRSRNTRSIHDDAKHVDQAADKQLQLESRQSVPSSRVKQASSAASGTAEDKAINQGLDHAGRLPNGIRPAYYKYPGLSELQKVPREVTPTVNPELGTLSSRPLGASPVGMSGSEESSSDSDDSSSNSDEDEDVDEPPSQTSSKKKSGHYPGMGGVMKLPFTLIPHIAEPNMARLWFLPLVLASLTIVPTASAQEESVEIVEPITTPLLSGSIATAIGSNSGPSTSVSPTLTNLISGTASTPLITSTPSSTNSLTATASSINSLAAIPHQIAIEGANYVYVGCFEGLYIQPITGSYTVGDVNQCGLICLGSTYFSLESGYDCTCGDSVVAVPARGDDSVCNVPCIEDQDQFCGGLKMLKRAQRALAAYSSSISSPSTATTQRISSVLASLTSAVGEILPSSPPSFSHYANTTSSTSTSSQSVVASSTSSLPYGCTDNACVSASLGFQFSATLGAQAFPTSRTGIASIGTVHTISTPTSTVHTITTSTSTAPTVSAPTSSAHTSASTSTALTSSLPYDCDGLPPIGLPTVLPLPSVGLPSVGLPSLGLPTLSLPTDILPTNILPTIALPTLGLPTDILPTNILPTEIPTLPTNILPTDILPTAVLPTDILPTAILPTDIVPTDIIPTAVLPTAILPTDILPTAVLPTDILPTAILPTDILPTAILPTAILPTGILPTNNLPTDILPTVFPTNVLPSDVLPTVLPTNVLPTDILPTVLPTNLPTVAPPTVALPTLPLSVPPVQLPGGLFGGGGSSPTPTENPSPVLTAAPTVALPSASLPYGCANLACVTLEYAIQQSLIQASAGATLGVVPTSDLAAPSTFVTVTRAPSSAITLAPTGFSTVIVTNAVAVSTSGGLVAVPVVNTVLAPVAPVVGIGR